jgi:predicted ArsR family transcriptional regulator
MEDITDLLSDSQTRLLELIKKRGEVTVDQAVDSLDLATTTIRQHLERLEDEDLVEHRRKSSGRGRPRHIYRLSSRAEQLFPSRDQLMLHRLLDFLSTEGHHRAIDDFFHEFWEERGEEFSQRLEELDDDSGEARLELLAEFLDEQGFMPEIEHNEAGNVEIRECNCPLSKAVESTRLPCRLEAEFLEQVVGRKLERVSYIPDGNNACVYKFKEDGQTN